jgi:serine phosphatase RsbU (regulator of sigma subunit)
VCTSLLLGLGGTVELLASTGTVLGLFRDWDCSIEERQLSPGDTLVLYTGGVTESFDTADEEFGEQRLLEALLRHRELPPDALLHAIVQEVRQFSPGEQHDDITLIVARCQQRSA